MDQVVKNKVIVFGRDNYNTLGLARQLGNQNLDLLYLMPGGIQHCATKSKFCKHIIHVKDQVEAIEYLLNNNTDEPVKPILIAGADLEAEALDQHREELIKHYIVPGTREQGLLTKVDDKNVMAGLARKAGFIVPKSVSVTSNTKVDDIWGDFPCFIKPSKELYGRKKFFKAKKCDGAIQLNSVLKNVRGDSQFILQEYIPKEKDILLYGCRMWDGQILIAGSFNRTRFITEGSDASFGYIEKEIPKLINPEFIENFMEEIDYYGLFSFEFGQADNKAWFFEVNLRNDGTSQDFYQLGANLPLAWVYSSAGLDYTQVPSQIHVEGWYMDEIYDCLNIANGNVSLKQWKADKNIATIYRYYDAEDLAPWTYIRSKRFLLYAKRLIIDKYRPLIVRILDLVKVLK